MLDASNTKIFVISLGYKLLKNVYHKKPKHNKKISKKRY